MAEQPANPQDPAKKDCGCGCGGDCGDKSKASEPSSRARRALLVGAGSTAFIATLANRRAFAQGNQCGPLSHLSSPNPSQQTSNNGCGGLTPGFWKGHAPCVAAAIGGSVTTITLGSKLPALFVVDPTSANATFQRALCNNVFHLDNAYHFAAAILDALTPSMNPSYGYTITSLNAAILAAHQSGASLSDIVTAISSLENDFNTNDGGCTQSSICPS